MNAADPVQAVAKALHAECLWIDADLAASLAESAVAAAEPYLAARLAAVEALADELTIAVRIERSANDHHAANLMEALQEDLRAALATGTTANQSDDGGRD